MQSTEHMEIAVLGQMLYSEVALEDGLTMLQSKDFALRSHRDIFEAIENLKFAGKAVDAIFVSKELEKGKILESVGGHSYIARLGEMIIRDQDIRFYCQQIKEAAMQRDLARLGENVMVEAMEEACEPRNLLLDVRQRLDEIEDSIAGESEFVDQKELMPRTIERIFGRRQPAIPTGLDELDKITLGGIRAGELWIVGGLPGRAKTSLARSMGRTASKNGIPVRVQTIEMPDTDWNALDVAFEAGVPAWKLRNPNFISREDKDALYQAIERVQCWPMTVDDAGSIHIRQLIAKARLAVRKRGTRLLIVDYVQRIKSDDKEVRHRIGNSAGELAEFAKETGCAVILLSQLSRQGDINIRPTMQHLKESGELEAHAHTILLNYRPVENVAGKEIFTGEDEIIVAKQRYGPIGSIRVAYDSDLLTFVGR